MKKRIEHYHQHLTDLITFWLSSEDSHNHPWQKYLKCFPSLFAILGALIQSHVLSDGEKESAGQALGYIISPVDFVSESHRGIDGYIDDLIVTAFILHQLSRHLKPQHYQPIWTCSENVSLFLIELLDKAPQMLNPSDWKALQNFLKTIS